MVRLEHLLSGALKGLSCRTEVIKQETSDCVLLSIEVYTHNPAVKSGRGRKTRLRGRAPGKGRETATRSPALSASPIAQLVRAPH